MKIISNWFLLNLDFIIDLRIMIEKEYFDFNQQNQKLFYLLSYLQTVSLFLSSLQNATFQCEIINLQATISYITRPFEYFSDKSEASLYFFILPLSIHIIFILSTALIKIKHSSRKMKIIKFIQNLQLIIKNLILSQMLMIMAFQQLLFVFFIELSLVSFYKSQDDLQYVPIGIFSIVTTLMTLSIQIISIKFDNPALFQLNLGKFHKSSTEYLQTFTFILIIITHRSQLRNQIQIIGILLIIVYLIRLKDIYFNFEKYYELQQFEIVVLSCCLCLVTIMTIADYMSNNQQDFETYIVIYILSSPIVAYILGSVTDQIFQDILNKPQHNIKKQNYKLQHIHQCLQKGKMEISKYSFIILQININQLRVDDQKFKYQQLLYCWLVKENNIFYKLIKEQKDQSSKLEYYLQYLKFNFARMVYETQIQQKVSEINYLIDNARKDQLIESEYTGKKTTNSQLNMAISFSKIGFHENLKLQIMKESTKNQFLQTNNSEQDDMEQVIRLFLQFEENNKYILDNMYTAINYKLQFLNSTQRNNSVFQISHEIVEKLYNIELKLIQQYEQFPSKKMQNFVIFYYAEIQNDFLSAFKYQNLNVMTEENIIKKSISKSYDFLKDNIQYVTVSLDDTTYKFDIESYSKGLINVVLTQSQTNLKLKLDDILPFGLPDIHVEYIERFLVHGKSKYFRQFSQAFFINTEKQLTQIDAVVDFLENSSKTSYVVFLKPMENNSPHIWVNQNQIISGITKDLIELLGIPNSQQQRFLHNINLKPIKSFIPSFYEILDGQQNLNISTQGTELNLSQFLEGVKGIRHKKFLCDMVFNIRLSPSNIKYYIITVYNCKSENFESYFQDDFVVNEEPIVYGKLQQQYNQKLVLNGMQNFETQFNSPRSHLINELIIDGEIDQINIENNNILETQFQQIHQQLPISDNKIISSRSINKGDSGQMQNFAIQSQASSIAGIRTTKYYKRYELIHKFMTSGQSQDETKIQLILFSLVLIIGGIYSIIYINLVNTDLRTVMRDIDVLTIKTTITGAQDSYMICINAFLFHSLQRVFGVISQEDYEFQVQYSSTTLNKLFTQLQTNYQSIIGNPSLASYIVGKNMTINQKYGSGVIARQTTIHEAFVLYIESSYGYQNIGNDISKIDFSLSFIVFQLSNYYIFSQKIEEIHQQMTEISIEKSQTLEDNLNKLFFPSIVISFVLLMISLRFYLRTLRKFDKLNQILQNEFGQHLKLEIDRIKLVGQFLNNEEYLYYQFDVFDNENKLVQIEGQLQQNTKISKNNPQLNKKPFLFKYIIFQFLFFLLYSSFQLTSYLEFIIYVRKIPQTIQYYDSIQQLQTSSYSLFISRSFIQQMFLGLFPFFSEKEYQTAQTSFNNSIINLKEFISTQGYADYNQLLLSQQYISEFKRFMSSDLCKQIDNQELIQWFCDQYLGGSLRRGYSTAISAILSDFQTQYEEQNQFNSFIFPTNYSELETGLILGSVIQNLCQIIINDIRQTTQSLSNELLIINILYIAFYLPICFLILRYFYQKFNQYFKIALRVITLLPQSYLFLDNQIDRELRQMAIQFEL